MRGRRANRYLCSLRASTVPIRRRGALRFPSPLGSVLLPALHLDVRRRPDIADLRRVHATEAPAGGDVWAVWTFAPAISLAVLSLRWKRPAFCQIRLAFGMHADRTLREEIARCGLLVLVS